MKTENLIDLEVFCRNHNIDISFIISLNESGLIELVTIKESKFVEITQLIQLERFIRFYYDLDINLQGIETITHLLNSINARQNEIIELRNKLQFYEEMDRIIN